MATAATGVSSSVESCSNRGTRCSRRAVSPGSPIWRLSRLASGLAALAPVDDAVGVALPARLDPGPASRAWPPRRAIDAPGPGAALERDAHRPLALPDERSSLVAREIADPPPGADAGAKARLGADRVAHARDHALVEQRVAHLALRLHGEQAPRRSVAVEGDGEGIRAELKEPGVVPQPRLGHDPQELAAELGRGRGAGPEHDPRAAPGPWTRAANDPAAADSEMAVKREAPGEAGDQVLASRLRAFQLTADELRRSLADRRPRIRRRRDVDQAAAERGLDAPRDAVDGVTLGHPRSLATRGASARIAEGAGSDPTVSTHARRSPRSRARGRGARRCGAR